MAEEQKKTDTEEKKPQSEPYTPPKGAKTMLAATLGGKSVEYEAEADWIVLRKDGNRWDAQDFIDRILQLEGSI